VVTVIRLCDEYGSWSCCLDYAAAIFSFLCSNRVASDLFWQNAVAEFSAAYILSALNVVIIIIITK